MFQTLITGIICLMGFGVGIVYVTPGGQAILSLVDFFGGGFIIFVIAIIEVISVRYKTISKMKKVLLTLLFLAGYMAWRDSSMTSDS